MKWDKIVRYVIALAFFVIALLFAIGAGQTLLQIQDIVSTVYGG